MFILLVFIVLLLGVLVHLRFAPPLRAEVQNMHGAVVAAKGDARVVDGPRSDVRAKVLRYLEGAEAAADVLRLELPKLKAPIVAYTDHLDQVDVHMADTALMPSEHFGPPKILWL